MISTPLSRLKKRWVGSKPTPSVGLLVVPLIPRLKIEPVTFRHAEVVRQPASDVGVDGALALDDFVDYFAEVQDVQIVQVVQIVSDRIEEPEFFSDTFDFVYFDPFIPLRFR
ncbi:MAG: hypothetical protein HW419_3800 [Deltaproteobacteria bacterium]|nr:hypothetical protein [Deltaproteobacteria bacterium]